MKKTVTVVGVHVDMTLEKRDGGTYVGTVFKYTDNGRDFEMKLAKAFIDKQFELKRKLLELNAGDVIEITLEKNGAFWNLKDVAKPGTTQGSTPAPASTKFDPKKTGKTFVGTDNRQDSIVFQNALAHATNIAIHNSKGDKVDLADIIKVAKTIAKVSRDPKLDEVEDNKVEPKKVAKKKSVVSEEEYAPFLEDDNIDFG